jgi:hypothetical protein
MAAFPGPTRPRPMFVSLLFEHPEGGITPLGGTREHA